MVMDFLMLVFNTATTFAPGDSLTAVGFQPGPDSQAHSVTLKTSRYQATASCQLGGKICQPKMVLKST